MSNISGEYAKALFMLAKENSITEEVGEAVILVETIFSEYPDYLKILSSFSIPLDERLGLLDSAFSGKVPKDVLSFIKLLCEKRHICEFGDCAAIYKEMLSELKNISNAVVTSAVPLSDTEKTELKEKLEKKSGNSVIIDYAVDESILGGLIVEIDGKIMDTSLKKHLEDVKEVINK